MNTFAHKQRHRLLTSLVLVLILSLSTACQQIQSLLGQPTYVPTPTFPPFPQPSPTYTSTLEAAPTPGPGPQIVTRQKNVDGNSLYTLSMNYPYLENAVDPRFELFNQEIARELDSIQQGFLDNLKNLPATPDPSLPPSFLGTEYKITHGDAGLLSVLFTVGFYVAGAAHPNQYAVTLNLDVANGKVLALSDLFNPGSDYLKAVSDYCLADLKKQDRLEWDTGALPKAENYRSWNITQDGLLISFDPYQVTSYAMGPQSVTIPFTALKEILNRTGPLAPLLN